MTAVLLAAGVGKRLLGRSGGGPKCLVEIGGQSLLGRLLDALPTAGVREAVVVVGFGEADVRAAVATPPAGLRVRCLTNPRYTEGAILSLWTAREALAGPVLVMDADVLCPPAMIARLVASPHPNCFLLDGSVTTTGEEQMLLVRDGLVRNIVRGGAPGYELAGESVGFLKLSEPAARLLDELLEQRIAAGQTAIEHEEVYPELLARVEVGFERVDGMPWTEIDFPEDVERAEREILPDRGMTAGPIRDAIVLASAGDTLRPVAGVPWLVRTILALQRAGIERCTLVGCPLPPADARIRCALETMPSLIPPADGALRLVVGAGAVIDATLVLDLQGRARPGEVLEVEEAGARVRVAPGPLVAGDGGQARRPGAGTLRHTDAGPAAIERALLVALQNPRDGWIDRLVYRRFSRPLTRVLLPTGISPNAVTVIGIMIGIVGGTLLALPARVAVIVGTVCLLVSGVLDCVDGELARLRFAESRLGHWLDVLGDTFVHLAVLAGLAIRVAESGNGPGWPVLAVLGLGVVGSFAVISWSEHTEARRRRVKAWENGFLDAVLSPLTTRDWYVFVVAFALIGRLDWLLWGAAVGSHVFWVVALVVLLRVLRY